MARPYPKKGLPPKKKKKPLKRTPLKRGQKPIKKISQKQKNRIKENKSYYQERIVENQNKNKGVCICENCGSVIPFPKGINVSHIISGGANLTLYHHPLNCFILCKPCEHIWTNQDKTKMFIYEESEKRKELILNASQHNL